MLIMKEKCNFCNARVEEVELVHHMTGGVSLACKPCIEDKVNKINKLPDKDVYYVRN